mgnify:FL=1|tara:strand:+ start:115 stop:1215 length:1101 start_codon:yes stop_codon:yes gene_type:complete
MKNSTINQVVKKAIRDLKKLNYTPLDWNDRTPIYIDRSRTDSHKISYITTKKRNELNKFVEGFKFDTTNATRKKYFFHTSPSKLLQKFFDSTLEFNDFQTSKVLQTLTQRLYKAQNTGEIFKSHTAEEIPSIYNTSNHEIIGSCMQEKPLSYFELYTCFKDNLKLYAEYNKKGVLVARALFWHDNEQCYLDRIYSNTDNNELKNDIQYSFYKKVMKAEGIKNCNAYNITHIKQSKNVKGKELESLNRYPSFSYLEPDSCIDHLAHYPYLDTFQFIDDSGNLTDSEDDTSKKLTNTDGTFEDHNYCECEHCGYETDRDELIYVEDEGIEVCQDCAVYSEADGYSYLADNCTYIGGSVESYVLTEDIH